MYTSRQYAEARPALTLAQQIKHASVSTRHVSRQSAQYEATTFLPCCCSSAPVSGWRTGGTNIFCTSEGIPHLKLSTIRQSTWPMSMVLLKLTSSFCGVYHPKRRLSTTHDFVLDSCSLVRSTDFAILSSRAAFLFFFRIFRPRHKGRAQQQILILVLSHRSRTTVEAPELDISHRSFLHRLPACLPARPPAFLVVSCFRPLVIHPANLTS